MMQIITHRGIHAAKNHWYSESSREAFTEFLKAGFGLEFDIQITKDGGPVVSHDASLARISENSAVPIAEMDAHTFLHTPLMNGSTIDLAGLIQLLNTYTDTSRGTIHALHLKHFNQTREMVDAILHVLESTLAVPLLVFDVAPEIAEYIQPKNSKLLLGASVAHPFDIARYNTVVGGTLLSVSEAIDRRALYEWVWLDEWDKADADGGEKSLYNEETFELLRSNGFKIAIVSPELHATSPHLLGGETHPDGMSLEKLQERWQEILYLKPDAICTDFPYTVLNTISQ